jgi:hypothetical protein
MASIPSVLSIEDIQYINALPEVISAKSKLDNVESGKIYFSIKLTDSLRQVILSRFGLNLTNVSDIPMRWIKGDTAPHIDRGISEFKNTYLVYLNDSPGEFVLENNSYPISENTGFIFNEGLSHKTQNTGSTPRLLLGPMNELANPVGASVTFYYPSQADALANTNELAQYGGYTILLVSGFSYWRIASNSTGTSPQNVVYAVGDTLIGTAFPEVYYLYPSAPCFLDGTTILCQVNGEEKYIPVEDMTNGTLVKTSRDGFKKVVAIGKGVLENPDNDERTENRLYKCTPANYSELTENLYITGCHSILVNTITDKQKEDTIKHLGKIFITDKKFRLMACVDERAEPWNSSGCYTIWHFALENTDDGMNYGVYANGGLLVETCAIRTLKTKSNLTLIE